jgi:endonuclease/exonuclease/phosphatase family metal-dependent hydrolase
MLPSRACHILSVLAIACIGCGEDRSSTLHADGVGTIEQPLSAGDIVLYAGRASPVGSDWVTESSPTGAGGVKIRSVDRGRFVTSPLANPGSYFEMTFSPKVGKDYRIWLRGWAENNSYENDSAWIQFSSSVTTSSTPRWRIGSTSALSYSVQDCSGAALSRWGWQDVDSLSSCTNPVGSVVRFESSPATLRVQVKQDGLTLDQIVIADAAGPIPGAVRDDTKIYPASSVDGSSSATSPLRVMQYNIHHGVGTDGRYDLDRIANAIVAQQPDAVSLNEVMYNSSYGNGENQPETFKTLLQQKTSATWDYVYARSDGNWSSTGWAAGNAVFSRRPFSARSRHALPNGAAAAQGTISVNGRTVNLFAVHVSYVSATDRHLQTQEVENWAATFGEDRILLGDFNTAPGTSDYEILSDNYFDSWAEGVGLRVATSPSGTSGFTHGGSRFDYIHRSRRTAHLALQSINVPVTNVDGAKPSDHDPLVATFTVD